MIVEYRDYKCRACGHVQSISTNHEEPCMDYCKECSWKCLGFAPKVSQQMFGHAYRQFEFVSQVS